jgi:pimeloyl-ACP methyl ester carboxylesterase
MHLREVGEGEPLILLHGWPQNGRVWEPLIPELSKHFRLLIPDLRGFGRSEAPLGADYSKHALATDILTFMDHEGLQNATVVGHDWGGWIAWLLALEHPERVKRFAALDISTPFSSGFSFRRLPALMFFGLYQPLLASPFLGKRLASSQRVIRTFIRLGAVNRNFNPELLNDYALNNATGDSPEAAVQLYRTFVTKEMPAYLSGSYTTNDLKVPGLSIAGGGSAITKMTGLPVPSDNLEVQVIPNAGHYLVDEAPDQVMQYLGPFLGFGDTDDLKQTE